MTRRRKPRHKRPPGGGDGDRVAIPLHAFTVGEPWDQVWHKMKRHGWRDVVRPRIIGTDARGLIAERTIRGTCLLRIVLARAGPGMGMYKIRTIERIDTQEAAT